MTIKGRKPRPLTREEHPLRDARLFVIATEDKYAPREYFRLFKNPRIKVHILPTEDNRSSPEHVLMRLDQFRDRYETDKEDEFWLMLDTDHWIEPNHIANFNRVCTEALQKQYQLANSNPCFEIWLLLHVFPLDAGVQFKCADDVVKQLRAVLGSYSKRTIDAQHFPMESIREAVERAKNGDPNPNDRWPQSTGTQVYKVVEKLI